MTNRKRTILLATVIFLIALIPRVYDLNANSSTADEPGWIIRGSNFTKALNNREFSTSAENLGEHPGIPSAFLIGYSIQFLGEKIGIIPSARLPFAILGAFMCLILFLTAREIWSEKVAIAASLFLAFSPVAIGLARMAHLDSILAFFFMSSILTYCLAEKKRSTTLKIISAIFFGLAFLTKIPAVLITLILFIWKIIRWIGKEGLKGILRIYRAFNLSDVVWVLVGFGLFVLLYSRMWGNPITGLWGHLFHSASEAKGGHLNFFLGKITEVPGPLFYLTNIPLRLNELLILSFLVGLIVITWKLIKKRETRDSSIFLLLWLVIFLGFISRAGQMGDRYALPLWPVICLIGAIGLIFILKKLYILLPKLRFNLSKNSYVNAGIIILVIIFLLPNLINFYPNYYLFYNHFIGGPKEAQKYFLIGFGEGHKEAMEYIVRNYGHTPSVQILGYGSSARYYYEGPLKEVDQEEEWREADYLIIYINMLQRKPDLPAVQYAKSHKPVHTVILNGAEMAFIYKLR